MNNYNVSAKTTSIYSNEVQVTEKQYKAESKEKALQGFKTYLKSNPNLKTFNDITIQG